MLWKRIGGWCLVKKDIWRWLHKSICNIRFLGASPPRTVPSCRALLSKTSQTTRPIIADRFSPVASHQSPVTIHPSMPDTVHPEIIDLARRISASHGTDPSLVCAVLEQDSAWNPWP